MSTNKNAVVFCIVMGSLEFCEMKMVPILRNRLSNAYSHGMLKKFRTLLEKITKDDKGIKTWGVDFSKENFHLTNFMWR